MSTGVYRDTAVGGMVAVVAATSKDWLAAVIAETWGSITVVVTVTVGPGVVSI